MLKNKLVIKVFSSGMQALAVQVLGGLFFYIASIYLTKGDLGTVSWLNAICVFITTFLGMGLEQIVVRRIAISNRSDPSASAFLTHTIIGFIITLILLIALSLVSPNSNVPKLLPWFFVAQGLLYIGIPLKQFLNARERFTPYGMIALISNTCKILIAWVLIQKHTLSVNTILMIMIGTAGFELCSLIMYMVVRTNFGFKFRFKAYVHLLKGSFAQYISVIFDMSLSRMDWVLLGFLTSNITLADYSFAYRSFELAKLPIIIIAPIILPRLSRIMALNKLNITDQQNIDSFNRIGVFFTGLVLLTLNILWVPMVSLITKGKYGDTNAPLFLMLSVCIPLQFFINMLWSISFGAKKYKQVSAITIGCAATNIVFNLILIPLFGGAGAAAAFLITTLAQAVLYWLLVTKLAFSVSAAPLFLSIPAAVIIYFVVGMVHIHFAFQFTIALVLYTAFGLATGMLSKWHIHNIKLFLS